MRIYNLIASNVEEKVERYPSGALYFLFHIDSFMESVSNWPLEQSDRVFINGPWDALHIVEHEAIEPLPYDAKEALVLSLEAGAEMAVKKDWTEDYIRFSEEADRVFKLL